MVQKESMEKAQANMQLTPLSVRLLLAQPILYKFPKLVSLIPPALKIALSNSPSMAALHNCNALAKSHIPIYAAMLARLMRS